jgi:hypothetical protein
MSAKFTIKQIFKDHWDDFCLAYPNIRPVVFAEVEKALECGDLSKGYAFCYREHCNRLKYVPFRCKSRFRDTCGVAYGQDRADSIAAKLINCKHRHIVFTVPEELRIFFRRDRSLLDVLFVSAAQTVKDWFAGLKKSECFTPGIVCGPHTFGRDLKWNPHIHMLVTEGASGNSSVWRPVRYFPFTMLRKRWQTTLLVNMENILGKNKFRALKNRLYRKHTDGFYVHAPDSDFNSPNVVANYITRYIGRPVMARSRIMGYDGALVTFWYQRHEDNERVVETVSAFEFIKRLIVHIPEKYFNMLRYYGLYAMKHKFDGQLFRLLSRSRVKARLIFRRWAWRIERSFGFDPTKCECGNYMEFLCVIFPRPLAYAPP